MWIIQLLVPADFFHAQFGKKTNLLLRPNMAASIIVFYKYDYNRRILGLV